ncbi:MAG: Gfo/Idh/MocA family oxidoreductase [Humibacillus sp.]
MKTSGDMPLVVGVVGAGGIARPHLLAWSHLGADIVVFSQDGAQELASEHGARVARDLDDLLLSCEVVDVCTPSNTHHEIVLRAAAAGRHVICEKPLSQRWDEAVSMIAACEAAGVQLHPGQVVRFFPAYAAAKEVVASGRIGAPAVLRLTRRGARPEREWFADPAQSGGILVDQMIHDFDVARWIAGDVVRVFASVRGEAPGPTVAVAVLTHADGALTHVTGGWGHRSERFRTSFWIAGAAGLIRHASGPSDGLVIDLPDAATGGELLPVSSAAGSPFVAELAEFAAACMGGDVPRVTATDSLAALGIALAAAQSAATGEAVEVAAMPRRSGTRGRPDLKGVRA